MSLLFGNLVQDFVNFETAIRKVSTNDPESTLVVEEAARAFRHTAAKDSSYLMYMGASLSISLAPSRMRLIHPLPMQALACLSALTFTCVLGSILPR